MSILYVNGDSHSAGAETFIDVDGKFVSLKSDDSAYWRILGTPEANDIHPECVRRSYGTHLAKKLDATLVCDALPGGSNDRIFRTTEDYLINYTIPDLLIIGWSTWEREEWWDKYTKRYWQINAGGIGEDWPQEIKDRYKNWAIELNYQAKINKTHRAIHNFHLKLQDEGINHYFFTCYEPFTNVESLDWSGCYLAPYDKNYTYYNWCQNQGFKTVNPTSYHYGADAHEAWAEFLYPRIVQSCLTRNG
jgi:hypothetical protein